jgi:hypothetical protein
MRVLTGIVRICFVAAGALGLLVAETGCWVRGRQMPTGHSSTSGRVPGLKTESGHFSPAFHIAKWKQGLTLIRVDDITGLEHSEMDFYQCFGSASNERGARYTWRLYTPDGRRATFRIDDKQYDLSEGALFVIKAKVDKVEVHQLNRDLGALPFDSAVIGEFLKNDAEVQKIFGVQDEEK